jgi:integrase
MEEVMMFTLINEDRPKAPWNKGRLTGQKRPLKLQEIWAIRVRLQLDKKVRDLAMFNLAIDSKLRASDMVRVRVSDVARNGRVLSRTQVVQKKTGQPVQFEITRGTREALERWIDQEKLFSSAGYLFSSRLDRSRHISTRQYSRIVTQWIESIGLDTTLYGTHSLRRTKASLIYKQTKNLRAVQLLLGHTKLESTVRYLGIEVDDAIELAENTEI